MNLSPDSTFGPYVVESLLGRGGMGEVYRARDTRLGRSVALKLLPTTAADETARRRLLAEARLSAHLDHPNICAIYEVGEHEGRDFLALQLVEGCTLAERLTAGPLPEHEALERAIQVGEALAHAHARGVIHRDLTARNVMVTPEGRTLVLDFGLARATGEGSPAVEGGLTVTGTVPGTPGSMSPEQARGEPLDARTDVFSFGILLHEMLAGRSPFAASSAAESLAAVLTREPPPPPAGPGLQRVVGRCLEKDRERRYASMGEVLAELRKLRAPAAEAAPRRRGRKAALIAAALVLAAAAALAAFVLPRWLRPAGSGGAVRTLAVLPFRALAGDVRENYLGLGMADAVISRLSQGGGLVVRPTSAVRRYADADIEAPKAAEALRVDAVLEGTWQRAGDRLRVTVNLLRAADGASLWSDRFDARSADIFDVQDQISEQLASRLRGTLARSEAAGREHGGTRNPQAYELYAKARFHFAERGYDRDHRAESDKAIRLFEEAVRLDPGYARARAGLAEALVWTALFIEHQPAAVARARRELAESERLDPQLGIVHLVRSRILYSQYESWNMDAAIREQNRALREDPSLWSSDLEVGTLHYHLGLLEPWQRQAEQALAQDPANERMRHTYVFEWFLLCMPEEGLATQRRLFGTGPDARYHVLKGDLRRAAPLLERALREVSPVDRPYALLDVALLRALQGRKSEAARGLRAVIPTLPRDRAYHHSSYQAAQTYALMGDAGQAVRWLQETVDWGFPCLPLFERDPWLEPVRRSPEYRAFLEKLRPAWERYRRTIEEPTAGGPRATL